MDKLNQYPHFKTNIEGETAADMFMEKLDGVLTFFGFYPGIDVHYVHVKPKKVSEGTSAIPLIMVHGWPGSFFEFYRLIPLLTEPSDPGDLVFEVVCPSIPGYGFSDAPRKKGQFVEI